MMQLLTYSMGPAQRAVCLKDLFVFSFPFASVFFLKF